MRQFFIAQKDWDGSFNPHAVKRRIKIWRARKKTERKLLNYILHLVRSERERLAEHYLQDLADRIELESLVAVTPNLQHLLNLAAEPGDGPLDKQRRHEAIRLFDETCAIARMEQLDPIEKIHQDLEAMLKLLTRELFETDNQEVLMYTYHDRDDCYRVADYRINERLERDGLLEHENRLVCRTARINGTTDYVALHHRIKRHVPAWLKMQKQVQTSRKDPFNIVDRRGLKLIVPTIPLALQLVELITAIIEREGGSIVASSQNLTSSGRVDQTNGHSSPNFKTARMEIWWRERFFELQITTFLHYYSSTLSVDMENHAVYRLLQCFDFYFPFLFPTEIYHIDWTDETLRRQMMAREIARLGWLVDRNTLPVSSAEPT